MIILDKPFVSGFLKQTVIQHQIPVLRTDFVESLQINGYNYFSEKQAIEYVKDNPESRIYTNSENAIEWIEKNLSFSSLPSKIALFKDKVRFRDLIKEIYPEFLYQALSINDFDNIEIDKIPKPFIIKPAIGFFSMAVYKVNSNEEWYHVKNKIRQEIEQVKGIYPREVMDTGKFIIEEIIEGDEYAIDAYFNSEGQAVVLNIMNHIFSSGDNFSDRLYITSEKIIKAKLGEFENFLNKIGFLAGLKNFPLHMEVRIDHLGTIKPIEINPLRFGAWCTTADATWYAYELNSIASFFAGIKPDWDKYLSGKEGKTYAMIVLENSTGYSANQIESFDYDKLLSGFEKPIDLRKVNYHTYPVFGFLFVETRNENFVELERILKSDLTEYLEYY